MMRHRNGSSLKTYASSYEERQRAMMRNEDMWPAWPVLPLKRIVNGDMQPGLLYSGQGPVVFLTYMYKLPNSFKDVPTVKYENYDAILTDGWVVD